MFRTAVGIPGFKDEVRTSKSSIMATMPPTPAKMRATLEDVARHAEVSLATVDRVLNKRAGVRASTVEKVRDAVQQLDYRPDAAAARLARARHYKLCFVLPSGSNSFVALLRQQIAENQPWMSDQRLVAEAVEVDVFEPRTLATELHALAGRCDGVIVMALDHPLVKDAIDALVERGLAVITLVSDVPASKRQHFVGIDNVAAGRTAGTLVGRFVGKARGSVGIVVGSLSLRDHAERCFGFNQVMAAEYPGLTILPPVEGKDDDRRTEKAARELFAAQPKLAGLYSVGAGNAGIISALHGSGRAADTVFVGHELSSHSRAALLSGTMDAVINQDAGHEVRSALRLAFAHVAQEVVRPAQERIRIDIYLKDNLP